MGLLHAALLRDLVRAHGRRPAGPRARLGRGDRDGAHAVVPRHRRADRARLAAIEADARRRLAARRRPIPGPRPRAALGPAMMHDPDVFRAGLEISGLPDAAAGRA